MQSSSWAAVVFGGPPLKRNDCSGRLYILSLTVDLLVLVVLLERGRGA
jgi:hypothetical protein